MRIIVDLQGAQGASNATRGIGHYSVSFVEALIRNCGQHEIWIALNNNFSNEAERLRSKFAKIAEDKRVLNYELLEGINYLDPSNRERAIVAELMREAVLASVAPDYVHVSSLFEGLRDDSATSIGEFDGELKTSVTLYDLIPYVYRETYLSNPRAEQWYIKKLEYLRKADLIFSISESTAREGMQLLDLPRDRLVNVSTAANSTFLPTKFNEGHERVVRKNFGLTGPFLLYTGGIDLRKNIERLIEAFGMALPDLGGNYQLAIVCAIEPAEKKRLQKICSRLGMSRNEVVFTGFISELDLLALYNLCHAFVFPSWHEGFGMPALEAMQCGAAVVASNTSSLPEVVGNQDALFDPFSTEAIAGKIARVCKDENFRTSLKTKGLQQAKKFNWDSTARLAIAAYENQYNNVSIPRSKTLASAKPRLAMITPIPPDQSGIADYVAELVPELSKYYRISIFTQKPPCANEAVNANAEVLDVSEFPRRRHLFDRILYQFGNSNFHSHMFDLLARYPGTVVLHDFFLSGPLADAEFNGNRSKPFTSALLFSHGREAVGEWQQEPDKSKIVFMYPANLAVLHSALGLIVHSQYSRQLAETWYGKETSDGWIVIPHLKKLPSSIARAAARKRLNIEPDEFVVCSFGGVGPTKQNIMMIDAWIIAQASKSASRLIFAGRSGSADYEKKLRNTIYQNAEFNITITGTLDTQSYIDYLQAADCAVQLRTMSRGETSGSVLDCMAYGVPVIASANGAMAELPPDCVSLLPENSSSIDLAREVDCLWENKIKRQELGACAKQKIFEDHSPEKIAVQFLNVIEKFYQGPETVCERLIEKIAKIESPQHSLLDWKQISVNISKNHEKKRRDANCDNLDHSKPRNTNLARAATKDQIAPVKTYKGGRLKTLITERLDIAFSRFWPRFKSTDQNLNSRQKLFIDVTYTVNTTWKSGIQRVVRNIAKKLTDKNSPNDRFEPVLCFSDGQKYFIRATIADNLAITVDRWRGVKIRRYSAGDRVFMLDSSWEFYKTHHKILRKAQLAGAQVFSCLYDMVPLRVPALCHPGAPIAYTPWFESALSTSDGFVCISKAVADELLELLKAIKFPRKMKVGYWPLGADFKSSTTTRPHRESFNTERPRFLMVGTIEPRKNHLLVLHAFSELWAQGFGGILTIVGKRGWCDEHIVLAIKTNKEFGRKLMWLEDVNDDQLIESYKTNDVLIAASHAEGFGLPIVEGLQHGCQVLASDIPVFREVAGSSASVRYFLPDSIESLVEKIQSTSAVASENEISPPTWIDWNESARRLAEVIIDDKWYREYTPPKPMTGFTAGVGNTHISGRLSPGETSHRLAIIGPVARLNGGTTQKYTVKVTNESKEMFSSRGNSDGSLGIFLGHHIVARDGSMLRFENPRTPIPFVIPPGDSVYLSVEISLMKLPHNAAFLEMEMVQEGGEWWGQPLRVAIFE